jgi:hypothetical protein
MTKKITMKPLLLAAVAAFGLAISSSAQSANAGTPAAGSDTGRGLLGQTYVGIGYGYTDLHDSSVNFQGLNFQYNQPLNTGFDLNLGFGDSWSSPYSGTRIRQQTVSASAIAFVPNLAWGRPFIGVNGGWMWTKTTGARDNSFLYGLDTGVEFQVTKELSLTPMVSYTDAASLHVNNKWGYGVKANYWITDQWGLNAGVGQDNKVNMTYSVGTTFRF